MSTNVDEDWTLRAACATRSPDELFVQGAAQRQAREICFRCPVRLECLVDALDNRIQFGVWGGMTERERRALLRNEPDVQSWWATLGELDAAELDEFVGVRRIRRSSRAVGARP
ncbi:WhiB family transcriptional regulator [Ruania suaedae]|uniref:WhiB family transcriptional regulator n=1 Tax=Ruania suaedae TaxID=2897774 RepID=UPI001E366D24|nr:WhiB family transcriptional regulator [Ruania suaedae]UFU03393.1 WhiB family transcriptional regulator [Ruania suaedae]